MSESAFLAACFTRTAQTITATFNLTLDNHLEEVWAELTESARLSRWLAPGTIELKVGGLARIDFSDSGSVIDSPVTAMQPLRLLAYSWSSPGQPDRPIRWELEPLGPMTRLTLQVTVPSSEDAARAAAGWSAHLEMLWAALMGVPVKFPLNAFKAARAAFAAELSEAQAQVA